MTESSSRSVDPAKAVMLTDIILQLETGSATSTIKAGVLDLGAATLPQIPRHSGDRNRTSPFAFTGNKFEFRAVGSDQAVAWPNTIINVIVSDSIATMVDELESKIGGDSTPAKIQSAASEVLKSIIKQHKRVLFDGDNYTDEWKHEAEQRGLPHLADTVASIGVYSQPET